LAPDAALDYGSGTPESPTVVVLGNETTVWLLAGEGLIVLLLAALLITSWGGDS
jgi:hypothetical protein